MPLTRANARRVGRSQSLSREPNTGREREVSSPSGGGGSRNGSRLREVALERAGSGRRSRSRGSRASEVNRETSGNVTRTVGEQRQSREGQGDRVSRSRERSRRTSNRRSRSRSRRRTVSVDNETSRMLRKLKKKVEKMERKEEKRRDFKSAGLREQAKHAYELMDWQNIELKVS